MEPTIISPTMHLYLAEVLRHLCQDVLINGVERPELEAASAVLTDDDRARLNGSDAVTTAIAMGQRLRYAVSTDRR